MYWIDIYRKEYFMRKKRLLVIVGLAALLLIAIVMGGCAALFGNRPPPAVELFWDTATIQNVTRLTDDGMPKRMPKVSPDGKMMLYGELSRNQWNLILLRDINVPAKTPLASNAFNPSWYRNNTNFVYVTREGGSTRIIRSAIAGGGRTYVTRNPVGRDDDMPSIRGDVILFQTFSGTRWQIASMKDNGTEITFLGDGESPSWHPTLPKFLFVRQLPGEASKIFEMDLATLQVTELYSDPVFNSRMPSYSADGRYILFQKGAERVVTGTQRVGGMIRATTGTTNKWQIYIMRADGSERSTVTLDAVNSFHPSMDATGNIYFVSDASGKDEIYRARINLN
jgi:TolB protein